MVKNLPEMQETWVQSLGLEHLLGKGMATHSSILAWKIPLPSCNTYRLPWVSLTLGVGYLCTAANGCRGAWASRWELLPDARADFLSSFSAPDLQCPYFGFFTDLNPSLSNDLAQVREPLSQLWLLHHEISSNKPISQTIS